MDNLVIGSDAIGGSVIDSFVVTRSEIKFECASETYHDAGRWEDKFCVDFV